MVCLEKNDKLCVYCGSIKSATEFTSEHVIPKAIGGNLIPTNPFLLENVCRRCNNIAGIYIDGPYIKSWFTQNYRAESQLQYVDLRNHAVLPLHFMGLFEPLLFEGRQCDFWLGPTGDRIYHFHYPYPEEPDTPLMIGTPTYLKDVDLDPGFAFLFIRATNPAWHGSIIYSFIDQFSKSELYLGNGPAPEGGIFKEIPNDLSEIHRKLVALNGAYHKVGFTMNIDYADRFLAKIALGMGALLLTSDFVTSDDANLLRNFMWSKSREIREQIELRGSSFWADDTSIKEILSFQGGHFLAFIPSGNALAFSFIPYGKQEATIQITSNQEHWKGKLPPNGVVYVLIPGLQRYAGPINLENYIAWKSSGAKFELLDKLKGAMSLFAELPPYDQSGETK